MIINVEVMPYPYEPFDKTLKRFVKKCKKEDVVKEHCERLRFKSKREKRQEALKRAKKSEEKDNF